MSSECSSISFMATRTREKYAELDSYMLSALRTFAVDIRYIAFVILLVSCTARMECFMSAMLFIFYYLHFRRER